MKWFVTICVLLMLFATTGFAETMYVSDIVKITLRTGQGTDHKIIEMIQSGQQVEAIETGQDWTRIRLPGGTEGWVLSRLLTDEIPKSIQLESLKTAHAQLLEKVREPLEEIQRLETESARLSEQLAAAQKALSDRNRSCEELKARADVLARLEVDYQKATARLAELAKQNERLEQALTDLQRRQIFRWFLAGAGVLLLGIIIGISARQKRRRSSLL